MKLQLNDEEPFKEYRGRNIYQMPALVKDGRVPLSVAGLMQRRLEVLTASEGIKSAWWDNYFDTGDAILYRPSGKIKVVLDSSDIRRVTPDSTLRNGALVLHKGAYDAAKGVEFSRDDIKIDTSLTLQEAKNHPMLNVLAREDSALLNEYVDAAFKQGKERFNFNTNIGLYISGTPERVILRSCLICAASDKSILNGDYGLDGSFGRLVGVVPEVHRSSYAKLVKQ